MRIFFSAEDLQGWRRTVHLRAALLKRGHAILLRTPITPRPPRRTELWLHCFGWNRHIPIDPAVIDALRRFEGTIAFLQVDDDLAFFVERLPADLLERTKIFLRNQWESDETLLPVEVRARRGYLLPLLRYKQATARGEPLRARRQVAMFYGAATGSPATGTAGARTQAVRILKEAGLPFEGGLVPAASGDYSPPPDLVGPRLEKKAHARALRGARICVAPWGNNQITYRFYEGLAYRCLVVAQSLRAVDWLHMGLTPGEHYVEVRADLSDLAAKVEHYLGHDDEAQSIADAGHEHFVRHFTWRGLDIPDALVDRALGSWGDALRPVERPSVASRILQRALPVLPCA